MFIRPVRESDATAIVEIYNHYITKTTVTFEIDPVTPEIILERIKKAQKDYTWIVAEADNKVVGYAYAGAWRTRRAYFRSAESSVYLNKDNRKSGIGRKLYTELLKQLKEDLNIHAVMAAITVPNDSSESFHKKMGFERVGLFKETGFKFDQFLSVAYYELLL